MNRILKMYDRAPLLAKRSLGIPRRDKVETVSRTLSALLLAGGVAGGAALFLQAEPAHAEREVMRASVVQAPVAAQPKASKYAKPNAVAVRVAAPVRVWVDPPPVAAEEQTDAPKEQGTSVDVAAAVADPSAAPSDCLPAGLQSVLKDVEARFGAVTVVSTTELHTDNHSHGSARHKLHTACKAVDFRVGGNRKAVVAYLKSRPEVAGVNSYANNGVIHVDHSGARQVAYR